MQSCSNYESDTASFSWFPGRDTTRCRVSVHLSEIFSGIQQLQTISSVYQAPLFTLLHTNLKSRFTFGTWIYCIIEFEGNQSLVITFLTIAKNCKNSAAPGQVYCSVAAGAGVEILKVEITKWFRIKSCGLFVYLLGHKFGKFNVRRGVKTND